MPTFLSQHFKNYNVNSVYTLKEDTHPLQQYTSYFFFLNFGPLNVRNTFRGKRVTTFWDGVLPYWPALSICSLLQRLKAMTLPPPRFCLKGMKVCFLQDSHWVGQGCSPPSGMGPTLAEAQLQREVMGRQGVVFFYLGGESSLASSVGWRVHTTSHFPNSYTDI